MRGESARALAVSEDVWRFEDYTFYLGSAELRYASRSVSLEPRVAQVLAYLIQNAGHVVPRNELLASLWPGGKGSDGALNYAVRRARQALKSCGKNAISTDRGRGYRFNLALQPDSAPWHADDAVGLYDRKPPLDALWSQFESCRKSERPALSLVTGMVGIGKTALVQKFRHDLTEHGERSLIESCAELPVRRHVERLAERRPLVVFFDDIQEASAASWEGLRILSSNGNKPILYVAVCRTPISPARGDAFRDLLRHARTISLGPLSDASARRLLRAAPPRTTQRVIEGDVVRMAAGNPLFLLELASYYREGMKPDMTELFVTPSAMREALRWHFSQLPAPTLGLLQFAALVGEQFDARLLRRDEHQPLREVLLMLEPSIAQQIVQPLTQLEFRFAHPLFCEYLQKQVSSLQRREWHWAIGIAMERLDDDEVDGKLSLLAFHLAEGAMCREQVAKAAHFNRMAKKRSQQTTMELSRSCTEPQNKKAIHS